MRSFCAGNHSGAGTRKAADTARTPWFQKAHPHAPLTYIANFSMEFVLTEALPIYAGELGNVAGDHLKSASDLGVPVFSSMANNSPPLPEGNLNPLTNTGHRLY